MSGLSVRTAFRLLRQRGPVDSVVIRRMLLYSLSNRQPASFRLSFTIRFRRSQYCQNGICVCSSSKNSWRMSSTFYSKVASLVTNSELNRKKLWMSSLPYPHSELSSLFIISTSSLRKFCQKNSLQSWNAIFRGSSLEKLLTRDLYTHPLSGRSSLLRSSWEATTSGTIPFRSRLALSNCSYCCVSFDRVDMLVRQTPLRLRLSLLGRQDRRYSPHPIRLEQRLIFPSGCFLWSYRVDWWGWLSSVLPFAMKSVSVTAQHLFFLWEVMGDTHRNLLFYRSSLLSLTMVCLSRFMENEVESDSSLL